MLSIRVYRYGDHYYGCQCDQCLLVERTVKLELAEEERDNLRAEREALLTVLEKAEDAVADVQTSDYEGQLFITREHIHELREAIAAYRKALGGQE